MVRMAVTSRGHRWWDDSCVSEFPRDSRYQRVDEVAFVLPQLAPRKGRKAVMRLVREVLAADESHGGTDIATFPVDQLRIRRRGE